MILPPRGHWAASGDVFGCQNWGSGVYWYLVGRGRGCCKHPTMPWTAPNNKESSGPKCQRCHYLETLIYTDDFSSFILSSDKCIIYLRLAVPNTPGGKFGEGTGGL